MSRLLSPFTSVGSLTKKIISINPELSVQDVIELIRQATRTPGELNSHPASAEIVDEVRALELARATLTHGKENK